MGYSSPPQKSPHPGPGIVGESREDGADGMDGMDGNSDWSPMPTTATDCLTCPMRHRCITGSLSDGDVVRVGLLVERRRTLPRGQWLYLPGTATRGRIYALRQGDVKIVQDGADGSQFIDRFHGPGDIVGLDTIGMAEHANSAAALNTVEVCEIPFAVLQHMASTHTALRAVLLGLMQRQLRQQRAITLLLHSNSAHQRLAGTLLALGGAVDHYGFDPIQLHLPMSRQDLADHLGMGRATVSRLLAQMEEQGLLKVTGRILRIPCPATLASTYGLRCEDPLAQRD